MRKEYNALKREIELAWPFFVEEEYPYATEYLYDSSSFVAVYYTRKYARRPDLIDKTLNVILAARHRQPHWSGICMVVTSGV